MASLSERRYTAPLHSLAPTGPRFGDYIGLSKVLTPPAPQGPLGPVTRFLRHKSWMYTFAATEHVVVTCAIVDAGPTGTAFLTVADRRTGTLLADVSRPGAVRPLIHVNDRPGEGHRSRYRMPGTDVKMTTEGGALRVRAKVGAPVGLPVVGAPTVDLDLTLDITAAPALTVISELQTEPPSVSTTGKNAVLPATGHVIVRGNGFTQELPLTGGLGGFDFTSGHLPRHTQWRWAFISGRLPDGRRLGMNLTAGFSGLHGRCRENSLWLGDDLFALDPDATIDFDPANPGRPWRVATSDGRVALDFQPIGVHRESLNLGLIRSAFLQPVGEFSGHIRVDGHELQVQGLPGVVEDQDTLW